MTLAWTVALVAFLVVVAGLAYLWWLGHPVAPKKSSEPATAVTEARVPAKAMDEDNPPKVLIYKPRPGRALRPCSCHGRPIEPGTSVLFWPNPDGTVALFCPDGVREQE